MKHATKLATLLAALALPLALAQNAAAAGTSAGTVITNQATLDYTVGGNAQPTANSTQTTFNVDRKVNFNVTYVPAAFVDVFPGANDQALTYTVTNSGNDTQDFDLTVAQLSGGTVLGATDNIDAAALRLFLDDGDGVFDSGDTDITASHYLDELAPDTSARVFIVGNFPTPKVNADVAGLTLAARAQHGHGAGALGALIPGGASTDTNGAVTGNAIYTVFADVADAQPNLELVAGAFRITAPVLTIDKQANVIWDPVNYNTTPRSIPGSYVQYAITISNNGSALASANLTTIQDVLNNNTTLDPNLIGTALDTATPGASAGAGQSFRVSHTAATRTTPSPSYYSSGSGVTVTGQNISADFTALLPAEGASYGAGELKPGQSVTITFNVSIN